LEVVKYPMAHALVSARASQELAADPAPPSSQTVPPGGLLAHIACLEKACLDNPRSADLRARLGMAYAVNHDVYKSMDALSAATALDPTHFWAQLIYAELVSQLGTLPLAEDETLKAVRLARNPSELTAAQEQLREIRNRLNHLVRPLTIPALMWR
jgi:hypothetical protein